MYNSEQECLNDPGGIDWANAFRLHEEVLRAIAAKRLGSDQAHTVDDVMQEVALAVHHAASKPTDPEKIGSWLRSVTIHKVQDFWRKVQRSRKLRDKLSAEGASGPLNEQCSPFDWVLRVERVDEVRDAMSRLDDEDRSLLEQKYRGHRLSRDLASDYRVAVKTIEYRLNKARERLRTELTNGILTNRNES